MVPGAADRLILLPKKESPPRRQADKESQCRAYARFLGRGLRGRWLAPKRCLPSVRLAAVDGVRNTTRVCADGFDFGIERLE